MLIKGLQQDPALNSIKLKMSIISKKLPGMQRRKKKTVHDEERNQSTETAPALAHHW